MRIMRTARTGRVFLVSLLLLSSPSSVRSQDVSLSAYAALQTGTGKDVTALAFSPDGGLILAGDEKGHLTCWDAERRVQITEMKLEKEIIFTSFLSGGKDIVAVDRSGNVSVVNILTGEPVFTFESKASPDAVALDRARRHLAVATRKEKVELYDLEAQMPAGIIDARDRLDDLIFLGFDRLGEQLVAISKRAGVVCWNPATQNIVREVSLSSDEIHGSKSTIHAASTNRASNIFVVSLQEMAIPRGGLRGSARPGDLIRQNMVIAYDWNSGFEVKRVKYHEGTITDIALGPGNDHVAVLNNRDRKLRLIDLRKGELGSGVDLEEKPLVLTVSENDRLLGVGAEDGRVLLWELEYRGTPTADTYSQQLPTLSGRIRSESATEPALSSGTSITLAILPFEANGVPADIAETSTDLLTSSLAGVEYVTLVERDRIQNVVDELKFQMTGLTDEKGAEVGKMLNADRILICSVGSLGTSYVFNARIVDVETARVIEGREVLCEECRDQDLYDAVHLLASTIAR